MTEITTTRRDGAYESAYRRGIESAAIARGDTRRQRNPYRPCSARWLAFARGWDAWTLQALQSDGLIDGAAAVCHICGEDATPNLYDDKSPICKFCMSDIMSEGARLYEEELEAARLPYEPPAIVYSGKLTTRAGSRPCVGPEHGCYDINPEKLFGG